ncbi:unnamed protein product [Gongylonema pulchrum]|uniref:Queuosine 5'-phosphate N-glycosylase/hydrolase n=1 Tax=Gongylonema pulchrum TaxID=637853 RepID=A0A183E4N8_9BILA|nr:unnamed protein product [Gongylonema pulchrum]
MSVLNGRLSPRESAKYVVTNSSGQIKLSEEGVQKAARLMLDAIRSGAYSEHSYSAIDVHPQNADRSAVDWIFLVDTINFSFWSEKSHFQVTFQGKKYTGYLAACACINRALEEGKAVTNADHMERITEDDMREIFRADDGFTLASFCCYY